MRINGFRCDGCSAITEGDRDSSDVRDPGPFLPKDWSGGINSELHLCPRCSALVRDGALHDPKETKV